MTSEELRELGMQRYGGHGWQTRLAEELKKDPSTVRRWVSGAVAVPEPVAIALRCLRDKGNQANH